MNASNADPAELAKFGALAHRWWDPTSGIAAAARHQSTAVGVPSPNAAEVCAPRGVLDVGCGAAFFAEAMAAQGARVTGIDLSDKAWRPRGCTNSNPVLKLPYRLIAAEALAMEAAGTYDIVTSYGVALNTCPTRRRRSLPVRN
jgi:2-polyprenyl-6-hydroxyphenyl methylase/3-demethylubiquinone-9 3-methyltransferase